MTSSPRKWWRRARDARTGRFVKLADALRRPASTVVERIHRAKRR